MGLSDSQESIEIDFDVMVISLAVRSGNRTKGAPLGPAFPRPGSFSTDSRLCLSSMNDEVKLKMKAAQKIVTEKVLYSCYKASD